MGKKSGMKNKKRTNFKYTFAFLSFVFFIFFSINNVKGDFLQPYSNGQSISGSCQTYSEVAYSCIALERAKYDARSSPYDNPATRDQLFSSAKSACVSTYSFPGFPNIAEACPNSQIYQLEGIVVPIQEVTYVKDQPGLRVGDYSDWPGGSWFYYCDCVIGSGLTNLQTNAPTYGTSGYISNIDGQFHAVYGNTPTKVGDYYKVAFGDYCLWTSSISYNPYDVYVNPPPEIGASSRGAAIVFNTIGTCGIVNPCDGKIKGDECGYVPTVKYCDGPGGNCVDTITQSCAGKTPGTACEATAGVLTKVCRNSGDCMPMCYDVVTDRANPGGVVYWDVGNNIFGQEYFFTDTLPTSYTSRSNCINTALGSSLAAPFHNIGSKRGVGSQVQTACSGTVMNGDVIVDPINLGIPIYVGVRTCGDVNGCSDAGGGLCDCGQSSYCYTPPPCSDYSLSRVVASPNTMENSYSSNVNDIGCCVNNDMCVNGGTCYGPGTSIVNVDGDTDVDYCSGSGWKDCLTNEQCPSTTHVCNSDGNCVCPLGTTESNGVCKLNDGQVCTANEDAKCYNGNCRKGKDNVYYCASPNKECGQAGGIGYDAPYSVCRGASSSYAITYDVCMWTDYWQTGTCSDAVFADCGTVTCTNQAYYGASCGLNVDTNYICSGTDHCSTDTSQSQWWLARYTNYKCTAGTGACTTNGDLYNGQGFPSLCYDTNSRGYCNSTSVSCSLCGCLPGNVVCQTYNVNTKECTGPLCYSADNQLPTSPSQVYCTAGMGTLCSTHWCDTTHSANGHICPTYQRWDPTIGNNGGCANPDPCSGCQTGYLKNQFPNRIYFTNQNCFRASYSNPTHVCVDVDYGAPTTDWVKVRQY